MKLQVLIATTLIAAAFTTHAADSFTGASIGVSLGASHNKVEYGGFLNGKSASDDEAVATLAASYGFNLSKDWVGTVGVDYALNKQKFGSTTYVAGGTQTVTGELKDAWALSFAPGYRIAPNALLYGKVAYLRAKGEYKDTLPAAGTTTHTGYGLGFGYAYALNRNIELNAEYNHNQYSREAAISSNGKPKQDTLSIGISYRF